jgi:hypothetical protein
MRVTVLAGAACLLLLGGCGTPFDPSGLFGGGRSVPAAAEFTYRDAASDPRPAIAEVASVQVDRVPGGALVSAIGLPPTQGWFAAALVPERVDLDRRPAAENGELAFRFVALPPPEPRAAGTRASREISAGVFLSDRTLAPVRSIVVRGARDARTVRP